MQEPGPSDLPIAAQNGAELRRPEADGADDGSHDHASGQRVVQPVYLPQRCREAGPVVGQQVIGLRVEHGISQVMIIMMDEVELAVSPVGKPEARIDEDQKLVEERTRGWMTVQSLVLE